MKTEGRLVKNYKLLLVFTVPAIILAAMVADTWWRNRGGPDVEFVVPNGFHGIFVIKEDRHAGTKPEHGDGVVRYTIPESGILYTTDTALFGVWHTESAKYANGKPISKSGLPDEHIFRDLATNSLGQSMWIIGTYAESQQYLADHMIWSNIESVKRQ